MERHPAKVCQKCCYRLASLWFWWAATQAWWIFETSWEYFPFMFALGAGQIDSESTAGQAICDNSLGHHQNCLHNMRKLPYDHLVLAILTCNHTQLYTCRSTGFPDWCHALAFLQVGSKRSPSPDLTLTNEKFPASQYDMLPFRSMRRRLQTRGLSGSISSNIWLRFWVLSIKLLGLLRDCVRSGQDSANRLVNWLMESWHKNWFWNTGNKRVNSKAGMI